MNLNNKYSAFYCAIAKDEHFLEKPITLSCGHSICQQCITNRTSQIKCGTCGEVNQSDLNKIKESFVIKKLFSVNLLDLFSILEERFYSSVQTLKENIKNVDRKINVEIEFMKEEIEIRIESLKMELDKLKDELYDKLIGCHQDFRKQVSTINVGKYEEILDNFGRDLEQKKNLTETSFYAYQTQLKNLNRILNNLKEIDHHVLVSFNETQLSSDLVGSVDCNFNSLVGKMKLGIYEETNIRYNPSDICVLPNGNILLANYKNNNLTVYDSSVNLVKTIDRIVNHNSFEPFSIATNNLDKIFICENNFVLMTDLKFNLIKKFGSNKTELDDPRYILFHDDYLYVCDCNSMRIQKLNSNFVLKTTFYLDIKPRQIKIIDQTACVRSLHDGLFFYDLVNFQLKTKYGQTNGYLIVYDNLFFQFRRDSMEFDCFDKNGSCKENINLKLPREVDFEGYFAIASGNERLYIHSDYKKLIII